VTPPDKWNNENNPRLFSIHGFVMVIFFLKEFTLCFPVTLCFTMDSKSKKITNTASEPPLPKHLPHLPGEPNQEPFGTLLGIHKPTNVEVFSSNYKTLDPKKWEDRDFFQSYLNGVYTGYKWQCVELARRYLLLTSRVVFDSIPMAYDIFNLKCVRNVDSNELVRLASYKNGESASLEIGAMLIWEPIGNFKPTGHVAIVTNVQKDYVDIIEQNVEDAIWPDGQNYSRRLHRIGDKIIPGKDGVILGWVCVYPNEKFDYANFPNARDQDLTTRTTILTDSQINTKWLDDSLDYIKEYIQKNGNKTSLQNEAYYYALTDVAIEGLHYSTNELHRIFLIATDLVIEDTTGIKSHFVIPDKLWPKIKNSWKTSKTDVVSGRFDIALTPKGIKVYEYNADSASCLLECGEIQNSWSKAVGLDNVGRDSSESLFQQLKNTWWGKRIKGTLHFLCDDDSEEKYHAMYMKSAAEASGIKCKLLIGQKSFKWTENGDLVDLDSVRITNVWKTWSWRTAFNQLKDDDELIYITDLNEFHSAFKKSKTPQDVPRLVDVLLHPGVRVFEPLWTVLPSCKSILPVLHQLFPEHPYLLKSEFELTDELKNTGFVTKPVTGRCGANVIIFDSTGSRLEETSGRWNMDDIIYQELCMLPNLNNQYIQINTWAICGNYGGVVIRQDKSGIINLESEILPLRVVNSS
jgi:glutathionylspermidine amidase/synthetase